MKPDLTDSEIRTIRAGIRRKYAQVADPGAGSCFRYPTGREGMV